MDDYKGNYDNGYDRDYNGYERDHNEYDRGYDNGYQAGYQAANQDREEEALTPVIGLGEWMLTLLILAIPIVGFIMSIVWGFSKTTNRTKSNLCKAILIYYLIMFVLGVVFSSAVSAVLYNYALNYGYIV